MNTTFLTRIVASAGMLFALAPGIAAILCWIFLRESVDFRGLLALGGMTSGALLLVYDRHEHRHTHGAFEHEHEHAHDEHHRHGHGPGDTVEAPHTHPHRHEPLDHDHAHVHDRHHRHRH